MSKKLIHFLICFFDMFFNIIACFYSEIWKNYQIYILQTFIEEMTISASIHKLQLVK